MSFYSSLGRRCKKLIQAAEQGRRCLPCQFGLGNGETWSVRTVELCAHWNRGQSLHCSHPVTEREEEREGKRGRGIRRRRRGRNKEGRGTRKGICEKGNSGRGRKRRRGKRRVRGDGGGGRRGRKWERGIEVRKREMELWEGKRKGEEKKRGRRI